MDDGSGENCPFEFNFDPASFKVGDQVSYRVTGSLEGFPFMGVLLEVHDDHVVLTSDPNDRPAACARPVRAGRSWPKRMSADERRTEMRRRGQLDATTPPPQRFAGVERHDR